uniref:EF-hand domain-containing protein n=1 Tax=Globisporangium ultimum (strain ATCC 200006 / CBS 805.95 / DAOM BR144) TaxID=431595 RepID=K3WH94_GLOUD
MNTAAALAAWQQRAMRKARDESDSSEGDVDMQHEGDNRPPRQDDDDRDYHASWLQEVDADGDDGEDDDDGERDSDDSGEEQNAVIPWLPDGQDAYEESVEGNTSATENEKEHAQESPRHSEQDEEDGEDDEIMEDFSNEWADKYLSSPARTETAPSASTTPSATSLLSASDNVDGWKQSSASSVTEHYSGGMTKLFAGYGGPRSSFRNEIALVGQATEKAVAAAVETAKAQETTSALTEKSSSTSQIPRYQAETPHTEMRVHPIAIVPTKTEPQNGPISPNTLKRANSLYLSPTSASKALMKRQDSLTPNASRSQMLWNTESLRRNSRLLDEWKRKEIWHDFKRAEENVSGPQAKKINVIEQQQPVASEVRLENLLQHIRAEISSSRHTEKVDQSTSVASIAQHNSVAVVHALLAPSIVETQNYERRQTVSVGTVTEAPVALLSTAASVCSRSEYEQLLQEKQFLKDELENRARLTASDKERIKSLNERIQHLEISDRENKFLKDENQKHHMQELSSKELVKTLGDQLALVSKSEEQLKLQTQQLFQQNQSLQSDLLEKIAAEASKIQKMAHLSAEKENLMQELERRNSVATKKDREAKDHLQQQVIRRLLRVKRLTYVRVAIARWRMTSQHVFHTRCRALEALASINRQLEMKQLAKTFNKLKTSSMEIKRQTVVSDLGHVVDEMNQQQQTLAFQNALLILNQVVERRESQHLRHGFSAFQLNSQEQRKLEFSLGHAWTKLNLLFLGKIHADKRNAFSQWKLRAHMNSIHFSYEKVRQNEKDLLEAKDCVFSLSREKTKLEEKLHKSREEYQQLTDQLTENKAELQVVKHGYVTTVIRDTERAWLRSIFTEWRMQSHLSLATKGFRLEAEMAELKAVERDQHAKSVGDYNRVLRNDLERFQFFSQDKRIAVDVLTKKLLREEEKYKQMEEHQVLLEERVHSLRSQLSTFLEWEGLELPLSMLSLSKDITVRNLRELFLLHATNNSGPDTIPSTSSIFPSLRDGLDNAAPRMSMDSLLRMIEYSTLPEENHIKKEELAEQVTRHFPDYAAERGLLFPDFLIGLNNLLQSVFHESSNKLDQMEFWASLVALVDPSRCGSANGNGNGRERSPWAGRLSDDILQNQEKLLAMLEHETAVVERAVMEKSSLKHTYPTAGHASVASTFYEYQCDPMLPPETSSSHQSLSVSSEGFSTKQNSPAQASQNGSLIAPLPEIYSTWYQTAQIRDLFLSFHQPLLKVLMKYSNEKRMPSHGNQFCLQLSGILKMLDDMKLYPTYLSKGMVHHVFGSLCDRDGLLTPQAFTLFLGSCALEIYTKSMIGNPKPSLFPLSAREILLSFFCDLGFLAESEAPAPSQICFVGIDIENILWPLFEYYASSDDGTPRAEDERVAMTSAKFARFMVEIAGASVGPDDIYRRVMLESRRIANGASPEAQKTWKMHYDEFYAAISHIQEGRNKQIAYPNRGEAVRHWMQQTQ